MTAKKGRRSRKARARVGQLPLGIRREPRKKRRGRPPNLGRVPHKPRDVHERLPLHLTLRVRREVWNLRSRRSHRILKRAFYRSIGEAYGLLVQFSIQGNHIHLLVEAGERAALGAMMRNMGNRMAKGMNKLMGRKKGKVFVDRFHSRLLLTPSETRAALVYVLQNARKHLPQLGFKLPALWTDQDHSSAPWFEGWVEPGPPPPDDDLPPVAPPQTWMLSRGWLERGGGAISRAEMPA